MTPYTSALLLRAGFDPTPLEEAANRCFNAVGRNQKGALERGALYSTDETTQRFWDAFNAARMLLRGGDERMKEAA